MSLSGSGFSLQGTDKAKHGREGISLEQSVRQPAPLRLLSWLGGCGCSVLMLFQRCFAALGRGILRFFRDVLHGCGRIYRLLRRILLRPIRLRGDVARRAEAHWRSGRGKSAGERAAAILRTLGTVLLSENGILVSLFRIVTPLVCCGFLFSVVRYGTSLDYGILVRFNGQELGVISDEAEYDQAVQIVRKRLSYTEERPQMAFQHEFELTADSTEVRLLAGDLADRMLRSAEIELAEGFGVYLGETFFGAVPDAQPVRDALEQQLSRYQESLTGDVDEVYYPEEITYEKGMFLRENLTDPEQVIRKLTEVTEGTRTYTAGASESVYSVAQRFSVTPERIRGLNPGLTDDIIPQSYRLTVPTTERTLPVAYRKTVTVHAFVDYDVIRTETNRLSAGKQKVLRRGVKGERRNKVQITYTDGEETGRTLLSSMILSLPVDEELGIGTYTPEPFSKETRLDGTGQFAWPLNGGYISDVFISNRNHRGLDIAAPGGTEIYAAEDGVVTVATLSGSYGNYIKIDHGNGYETLYAHCSALLAVPGQEVTRGQVIALVGTTGHSTGNHLHFEVRLNGLNYNPADYLRVNVD